MVSAVKVFKKTSPNGKVTAYLSRRDFVDHITHTAPVDGVVVVEDEYLRGRRIFARVAVAYRYGRPEDEVMGLNFFKEFELVNNEVALQRSDSDLSDIQKRLLSNFGASAHPFSVILPQQAPCSVFLDNGNDDTSQPMGVTYELRLYVSEKKEERPHKRNSVNFAVRRVQFAPLEIASRRPHTLVSRGFTLSSGRLNLELSLGREIYNHGQPIEAHISVNNGSKKTVKSIMVEVIQHVEVTMISCQFNRVVASLESKEGCPITPGNNFTKTYIVTPLVSTNKRRYGIAFEGHTKDQDVNLASSTLVPMGKPANDALGIIVSYSVKVKLSCGAIGGELSADLPFKLMHPNPAAHKFPLRKSRSIDKIEFEEFARLRRSFSMADDQN
ncbi:arrestin homolog [Palaemon carinicauda]|uniref:arrestin homolog n=1 Tax=Palaemon carinicauda TaxID=392227 RepID=UPI0035B6697C